jgi:hypothetical protein
MKYLLSLLAAAGIVACSSTPPAAVPIPSGPMNVPIVTLNYESSVQQMSRNDVINASTQCEASGMRAQMLTAKRNVGGTLSEIIIDVQCVPRYRTY